MQKLTFIDLLDRRTILRYLTGSRQDLHCALLRLSRHLLFFLKLTISQRRVLWIKTWFRRLSAVVLVWSVLTTLSIFLATLLQCQPMRMLPLVILIHIYLLTILDLIWDSLYPKHCINLKKLAYASAALNVVQDLVIFIMPLPAFWVLQMNLRQKIGVMAMFSFGLVYVFLFLYSSSCQCCFRLLFSQALLFPRRC